MELGGFLRGASGHFSVCPRAELAQHEQTEKLRLPSCGRLASGRPTTVLKSPPVSHGSVTHRLPLPGKYRLLRKVLDVFYREKLFCDLSKKGVFP